MNARQQQIEALLAAGDRQPPVPEGGVTVYVETLLGLWQAPVDDHEADRRFGWIEALEKRVAATPAADAAEAMAKARYLCHCVHVGEGANDGALAASLVADLERLAPA